MNVDPHGRVGHIDVNSSVTYVNELSQAETVLVMNNTGRWSVGRQWSDEVSIAIQSRLKLTPLVNWNTVVNLYHGFEQFNILISEANAESDTHNLLVTAYGAYEMLDNSW